MVEAFFLKAVGRGSALQRPSGSGSRSDFDFKYLFKLFNLPGRDGGSDEEMWKQFGLLLLKKNHSLTTDLLFVSAT